MRKRALCLSQVVKTRCNPYIAGFGSCGQSSATKKPGFEYPTLDIFYANWYGNPLCFVGFCKAADCLPRQALDKRHQNRRFINESVLLLHCRRDYTYWSGVLPEKYFNQTWDWYALIAAPGNTLTCYAYHSTIHNVTIQIFQFAKPTSRSHSAFNLPNQAPGLIITHG